MASIVKPVKHWASALQLRTELVTNQGQVTGLQMSLYDAVYRTADVPYQEAEYYSDITEPTPSLVRFLATAAARLGSPRDVRALYHLDQGMGGGKSHALVGAYHMARHADDFFNTNLGKQVLAEAQHLAGGRINLIGARVVVLSADNMTPGKANPVFGPATTLHERFLWSLFDGDRKLYQHHRELGSDKAALRTALEAPGSPVLILLDELMDYVMQLSDQSHIKGMPGEQAFLSALMDAVDDVPQVAFVVVMIRSDTDERGYTKEAEDFRSYIAARLERNGITVAVSEAQDFAAIIQRRIFERPKTDLPTLDLGAAYAKSASLPWREQVFDRLGAGRGLATFAERLARTYPFHPDLMALVQEDWARLAGFQRVRSTVAIFATTAHYWTKEHAAGRWVPSLIGVGDLPVSVVIEDVLSSGLLHGNDRAVQGFRQVAATDISSKDGARGRAVEIDRAQATAGVTLGQPGPAARLATAIFYYSLVPRAQAKRGATRAEILAAVFEPNPECDFGNAETIFNALVSEEEGLGALDTQTGRGSAQTRYQLSTEQTVRMFYRSARSQVQPSDRDSFVWIRAREIASRGLFDEVMAIDKPAEDTRPLEQVFDGVDQNGKNRLVILDPRRWALLNGRDTPTRADIEALLGQGTTPLTVANAASCVVACVNTQRRDVVRQRAHDGLAWRAVVALLEEGSDQRAEANLELTSADSKLTTEIKKAYQHFAFLVRDSNGPHVEWGRFDDDAKTSLKGEHVWEGLYKSGRTAKPRSLSGAYVATLLNQWKRELSLKELSQQFTMNPAFPLVSTEDDIRQAVFQLLSDQIPWEIVDADGQAFTISSSSDLALGSKTQFLRRVTATLPTPGEDRPNESIFRSDSSDSKERPPVNAAPPWPATKAPPRSTTDPADTRYRQYVLKVPNRSIVAEPKRDALFKFLGALSDVTDPMSGADLQLIDLEITVTAAEGAMEPVRPEAEAAEVKWEERDEDLIG